MGGISYGAAMPWNSGNGNSASCGKARWGYRQECNMDGLTRFIEVQGKKGVVRVK